FDPASVSLTAFTRSVLGTSRPTSRPKHVPGDIPPMRSSNSASIRPDAPIFCFRAGDCEAVQRSIFAVLSSRPPGLKRYCILIFMFTSTQTQLFVRQLKLWRDGHSQHSLKSGRIFLFLQNQIQFLNKNLLFSR